MRQHLPSRDQAVSILESISDGVFTVDADWRISSFNRAAERITGISREEAIGRPCADVFRASMCEADCALRQTMKTGHPVINRRAFIVRSDGERVPVSVSTALLRDAAGNIRGGAETFRDLSLEMELRRELEGRFRIGDMVCRSAAMGGLRDLIPAVAQSSAPVLIQGETGTGKELLARALHSLGPRARQPFVAVPCGALPDPLLESELFGYCRGAFTGAVRDKPGRFALAGDGTLFLDEIGDISPAFQVRLLRVLQEHCYEPLGGTRSVRTGARIIAATNRQLADDVRTGRFREDLYYRLNVVRLALPPLRDRREDIPLLVEHFIERFNRLQGKSVAGPGSDILAVLMNHPFPGNVRELENIIERAFVLCDSGTIERRHLPAELVRDAGRNEPPGGPAGLAACTRAAQARAIADALDQTGGNRQAAARLLGMHKSTLFRKIRALGIRLPVIDGRSRHGC